jgi:hypothetical protein
MDIGYTPITLSSILLININFLLIKFGELVH